MSSSGLIILVDAWAKVPAKPSSGLSLNLQVGIGICTKSSAEFGKRGELFWVELDFVLANVIMALIADFMLVWLPAPTIAFRCALHSVRLNRSGLTAGHSIYPQRLQPLKAGAGIRYHQYQLSSVQTRPQRQSENYHQYLVNACQTSDKAKAHSLCAGVC